MELQIRAGRYASELDAAISAAMAAKDVILGYYQQAIDVDTKADRSPVTIADIESERVIRAALSSAFPTYGFYGEETGQQSMDSDFLWLVDPIDGTKSFVRDSPWFSTQIALMHRGEVVVGVSCAPAMDELAIAVREGGAQLNGEAVTCRAITDPADVFFSSGNIKSLAADPVRWSRYGQMLTQVARTRGYGDFCHYHQLGCGQADIVLESDVNILDIAALSLFVTEAGGVFTDLAGQPVDLETTSVLAASNQELHRWVTECLDGELAAEAASTPRLQ